MGVPLYFLSHRAKETPNKCPTPKSGHPLLSFDTCPSLTSTRCIPLVFLHRARPHLGRPDSCRSTTCKFHLYYCFLESAINNFARFTKRQIINITISFQNFAGLNAQKHSTPHIASSQLQQMLYDSQFNVTCAHIICDMTMCGFTCGMIHSLV